MRGSSLFLKAPSARTGPARTMTRESFVARSYACYAKQPPHNLVNRAVDGWLADRELSAFLCKAAGAASRGAAGRASAQPSGMPAALRTAAG